MKNFALTGAAGYIAPRHLKAIKDTGNNLVAAVDPYDSVGILERYFPESSFFTEFERFDRHIEKLRRADSDQKVDYVSICSPNNLHDAHIRFTLRIGANAICEKPLVLNPWNLDYLQKLEKEVGKNVYTILQLRVHPALLELKKKIASENPAKKHKVLLTYITARGTWYLYSWKGIEAISGGIATNIGIHLFDLLIWLFGAVKRNKLFLRDNMRSSGFLELENAEVRWYLSIDRNDLPHEVFKNNKLTYRSILIDDQEIEFTEGFTDLHTRVYEEIMKGKGSGIEDARPSVIAAYDIRHLPIEKINELYHPMLAIKS